MSDSTDGGGSLRRKKQLLSVRKLLAACLKTRALVYGLSGPGAAVLAAGVKKK